MSEERLEQVEQKLDSLISAIQSGFGSFERQLNDDLFNFFDDFTDAIALSVSTI